MDGKKSQKSGTEANIRGIERASEIALFCVGAKKGEEKMTEQTKLELIKSFAYGATPESLNEVGRLSISEAEEFQSKYAAEIEAKQQELSEGGWK